MSPYAKKWAPMASSRVKVVVLGAVFEPITGFRDAARSLLMLFQLVVSIESGGDVLTDRLATSWEEIGDSNRK